MEDLAWEQIKRSSKNCLSKNPRNFIELQKTSRSRELSILETSYWKVKELHRTFKEIQKTFHWKVKKLHGSFKELWRTSCWKSQKTFKELLIEKFSSDVSKSSPLKIIKDLICFKVGTTLVTAGKQTNKQTPKRHPPPL